MYLMNSMIIQTQNVLINSTGILPVFFKTTMKAYTVKNMKKIKKTFDEVRSIW